MFRTRGCETCTGSERMVEHNLVGGASGPLLSGPEVPNRIPRPKNRSRVVRIMSPPALPPRWGQAVAPPPTPHFTPQTSPRSLALAAESQMEAAYNSQVDRRPSHLEHLVPNPYHQRQQPHHPVFGTMHSLDERRQIRRHRRLRRVRSSASSLSRQQSVFSDENVDPIFHLRQQPGTVVYAYSFHGDQIDRRPILAPQASHSSHFIDGLSSQHHTRSAADIIHGFHHPDTEGFHLNRNQSDGRASLLRRRHRLLRHSHRSRPENDSLVVEYHRSPPHNSLSSSPQGGATTTTGSGSVSPDVSPILNLGENVTRLTTSPATPPSHRYDDDAVISRAVMTSSRMATRSAMRRTSSTLSTKPTKTVQWFADLRKRPEDISDDRKVVKCQVEQKRSFGLGEI